MSETFVRVEQHVAHLHEERARGDAFERVVAHFLRHDPTLGMRQVWTWIDWPGRVAAGIRATDLGIDLVAEDELGELVASRSSSASTRARTSAGRRSRPPWASGRTSSPAG